MNHSFEQIIFSELDESVHQIGLNRLNQFTVQAAQKLLNQNSLSDPWQSIWLEMSQQHIWSRDERTDSVLQSSSGHWTEETVRLGPKTVSHGICDPGA